MGINVIKSNNKEIFAFKITNNILNENTKVGKKLDDFEILQKLGEGSFGKVLKVKSKLNSKIYALKQLDLDNLDEFLQKKFKLELIILKKVDSPKVCKCINHFKENGLHYIIMKYYNNKDLSHFLKGINYINPPIKESILWDILHQCAEGLIYVHNQGIIHRDIKPENILMDDNKEIQIGDFGIAAITNENQVKNFSNDPQEQKIILFNSCEYAGTPKYMAPEIKSQQVYDQKVDVYSLGVTFYEFCYKVLPYSYDKIDMIELINDKNYSYDLRNIIFKMIRKNPDERIDSTNLYREIKKGYIKKYVKNSGIFSVIKCLFNFPNLEWLFTNNEIIGQVYDKNCEKKILYIMIEILQSLKDKREVLENLYGLRKILTEVGIKRKDNEEITPQEAIKIILSFLNYELNEEKNENKKIINSIKKSYSSIQGKDYLNIKEIPGEESKKLIEFNQNKLKINSFISENFQGILKIKRECSKKHANFLFRSFNFISFNCHLLINSLNKKNFDIYEAFKCLAENGRYLSIEKCVVCPDCNIYSKHYETKTIYQTPQNMIIYFDRSKVKNIDIKIDFDEQIMFNKNQVESNYNKEYYLLGIISEKYEDEKIKYISFIKKENNWILCDISQENNEEQIVNFEDIKIY